jgi:hypothetical protein
MKGTSVLQLPAALTRRRYLSGLAGIAVSAVSCGDETAPPASMQPDVLNALATHVFVPTIAAFDASAQALAGALGAFGAGATVQTLAAARDAWRVARAAWKIARAFGYGPTKEHDGNIDWTPVKPDNIEEAIASAPSFTADDIAARGTSSKGLLALEYLLFDPTLSDDAIVIKLTTDPGADARRSYVVALGADLAREATALKTKWDAFGPEIAKAGSGSAVYERAQTAIDDIVGQIVFQTDVTANDGIAAPLGLKTGGSVAPELETARLSDNTLADIQNELLGIEAVWSGRFADVDDLGIDDLVREKSAALADDVLAAIAAAKAAVAAVPPPMRTALTGAPTSLQAAFDAIIALKKILAADVVTTLGVTLSVNDNDGD